jgi:hypothetical protein
MEAEAEYSSTYMTVLDLSPQKHPICLESERGIWRTIHDCQQQLANMNYTTIICVLVVCMAAVTAAESDSDILSLNFIIM